MNVAFYFALLGCLVAIGQAAPAEQKIFDAEVEELETVEDAEEVDGYFEGDIELDDQRNAIRYSGYKWPNGIVPYVISSSYPTSVHDNIMAAMREIEADTKHGSTYCVRFRPKTSSDHDYIYIEKGTGCHSPIGKRNGKGTVSIGAGCERKGIIMHELLHSLGFYHEHTRYDRDGFVVIHSNNVPTDRQHNFNKRTSSQMTTYNVKYDYGSVMHYGAYTFAADRSYPSITPQPGMAHGITIGQRVQLSSSDVTKIQKHYGCSVDTGHIASPKRLNYVVNCNFEDGMCNLVQDSNDNFNWVRRTGSTPTSSTGPNGDHTNGGGNYVYAEASGHSHQYTRLKTGTFSAGSYCVSYALFDYGREAGKFSVKIEGNEVVNRAVQTYSGSQRNQWLLKRLNLNSPKPFNLVFESYIGNGIHSDVALDDIQIYHGNCV